MKKFIRTIAILLGLAGPCAAQTCPGSGCYELKQSSVTGNASLKIKGYLDISSITISTYDANGYSLKLASGITLSAGCINFPGGRQCGPAGSGTGDVIAASNNAFTGGVNSFSNQIVGAAFPFRGVNYKANDDVVYTTGTSSFHIPQSTYVFRGGVYSVADTSFHIENSTMNIITWNPTNGYRQWGTINFLPGSISSYTAVFNDDISVVIATTGVTGQVFTYTTAWPTHDPGGYLNSGDGIQVTTLGADEVAGWYSYSTKNFFTTDKTTAAAVLEIVPFRNGGFRKTLGMAGDSSNFSISFIVYNSSPNARTLTFSKGGPTGNRAYVVVDGALSVSNAAGSSWPLSNKVSLSASAYHSVIIYMTNQSSTYESLYINLDSGLKVVRGGYW